MLSIYVQKQDCVELCIFMIFNKHISLYFSFDWKTFMSAKLFICIIYTKYISKINTFMIDNIRIYIYKNMTFVKIKHDRAKYNMLNFLLMTEEERNTCFISGSIANK